MANLHMLKPSAWIAPVVALLAGGSWLIIQQKAASSLSAENTLLKSRLADSSGNVQRRDRGTTRESVPTKRPPIPADPRLPLDWKRLAPLLAEIERTGGTEPFDTRRADRLKERLKAMDADELFAVLDEIDGLDLPLSQRKATLEFLLDTLMEKAPGRTLSRQLRDGALEAGKLADAFHDWADKDLATALSWFDKEIGDGSFDSRSPDGKSESRLAFEAELMMPLFSSDPEAATRRLESLPEEVRGTVLTPARLPRIDSGKQKAFLELLRKYMPPEHVTQEIQARLPTMTFGGTNPEERDGEVSAFLDGNARFLDSIGALPTERQSAASEVAQRVVSLGSDTPDPAALARLRAWIETQAPGKSAAITGAALYNQIGDDFTFDQAAAMVMDYDKSMGTDDGLAAFLRENSMPEQKEKVLRLLENIRDEATRTAIRQSLEEEE